MGLNTGILIFKGKYLVNENGGEEIERNNRVKYRNVREFVIVKDFGKKTSIDMVR